MKRSAFTPFAEDERLGQIAAIVERVTRRRQAGTDIDRGAIERQHPQLMPELGDSLRALAGIEEAARKAGRPDSSSTTGDDRESTFEHDLKLLSAELNDYEILERLEYGGQGVVYRAVELSTKRPVAIKVLLHGLFSSDQALQRFSREVELVSRMRHPNIVTLYSSAVVQGRPYYVMEYVDGLPINDFVLLNGLGTREVVRLFALVCRAVGSAHQRGVIHRDLKPANILVDEAGQPHVLDFGFAMRAGSPDVTELSLTGQVIGTMPYMSPEQARGDRDEVDVRSDIYSLGVVLYVLLTDSFPYDVGGDVYAIRERILLDDHVRMRDAVPVRRSDRTPAAAGIDADIENIVHKALAREMARRYQSADAFADDLERYLAGDAVEARADSRAYLLRKTLRRYRVHATVAGGFIGLLVVFAGVVSTLLLQAQQERALAQQIAQVAQATLNDVVTEINEAVTPLPGGKQVRDRLSGLVSVTLPRLQQLIESSHNLNWDDVLAVNYRNQGDILYEEGRHADAEDRYRASLETSTNLLERDPQNSGYLRVAAMAHRRLGRIVADYETHYARAIEIEEELLQDGNVTLQPDLELCAARTEFGRRLYLDRQLKRADEALAIAQIAAELNPQHTRGTDKWRRLFADICALRGKAKSQLGDTSAGLPLLEKSVTIRNALIEEHAADAEIRHDLIKSYLDIGDVHRSAGRTEQAILRFEQAVKAGRHLVQMDPSAMLWRRLLFSAMHRLTRELLRHADHGRAEAACEEAVEQADVLVSSDPSNPEWKRSRASAHYLRGRILYAQESWESASSEFSSAAAIFESTTPAEEKDFVSLAHVAPVYVWLGKCSNKLSQHLTEGSHVRRAHDAYRELVSAQPGAVQYNLGLVNSKINLAYWHRRRPAGQGAQEARGLLLSARDILQELRMTNKIEPDHRLYIQYEAAIAVNLKALDEPAKQSTPS